MARFSRVAAPGFPQHDGQRRLASTSFTAADPRVISRKIKRPARNTCKAFSHIGAFSCVVCKYLARAQAGLWQPRSVSTRFDDFYFIPFEWHRRCVVRENPHDHHRFSFATRRQTYPYTFARLRHLKLDGESQSSEKFMKELEIAKRSE